MKWYVEIVSHRTGNVERRLGPYESERFAEKMSSARTRNMDHEQYFTRVICQ